MQTDVLVVGAGPTGLMLATELRLAGVAAVSIDASRAPSGLAKGAVIQPRTAEVFDLRGMMGHLLERALPGEPSSGHFGGLPVELNCQPWNTRYPFPVPAPQAAVEQVLTQRLAEYGVSVRHGHQLTALHADDDWATATVHDQVTGTDLKVRARYLVACDGGHSTVRKLLGIPFPGQVGTRSAVLAEVRLASISISYRPASANFTRWFVTAVVTGACSTLWREAFTGWCSAPSKRPPMIRYATAPLRPTRSVTPCGLSGDPTLSWGRSPQRPGSAMRPGKSSTTVSAE